VLEQVRLQTPAAGPARESLARNGAAIVARSSSNAAAIVQRLAPEHLVCDRAEDARQSRVAGTIFVGRWSAQATGDYVTGSNHVLPTAGAARWRGGLSSADFVRVFTVQTLSSRGLRRIGPTAIALARAEGLNAHARSIEIRL
jgi:histidinol dehydrogenase